MIGILNSRIESGIHSFHEGGGIYQIKTANGVVRTKYINFIKHGIPGSISGIDLGYESTSSTEPESSSVSQSAQRARGETVGMMKLIRVRMKTIEIPAIRTSAKGAIHLARTMSNQ